MINRGFLYVDDRQFPCLFLMHNERWNASRWLYGERRPDADAEIGLIGMPISALQFTAWQFLTKVNYGVMQLSTTVLAKSPSEVISLLARVILLPISSQGPEVSAVSPLAGNAEFQVSVSVQL